MKLGFLMAVGSLVTSGCVVERDYTGDSSGGGSSDEAASASSTSGGADAGAAPFDFVPSNVGDTMATGSAADVSIPDTCDDLSIDTTTGAFACGLTVPFTVIDQGPGLPQITAFVTGAFHVGLGKTLRVHGANALAIIAHGDVVVEGTIDATPPEEDRCQAGPGGFAGGDAAAPQGGAGLGPGGGPGGLDSGGAAGGTFGGLGGKGGNRIDGPAGAVAKGQQGEPALVPLLGGSGGGARDTCGGGGGGAIQISSATSIHVIGTGGINAGGGGPSPCGAGGGSGGAILLEAPTLQVDGFLVANGGGGSGDTTACSGAAGDGPACGGATGLCSAGGSGSSAINSAGAPGADGDFVAGGGGGGGGRIRINSKSGTATVSGTLSPGAAGGLATQGKVAAK